MITKKALEKARILAFWEKHGLKDTIDHSGQAKRTLQLACIIVFVLKLKNPQVCEIIKLKKYEISFGCRALRVIVSVFFRRYWRCFRRGKFGAMHPRQRLRFRTLQ